MDSGRPFDLFPILYVRDVPASLAFYCGLLGFEEIYRFPPRDDAGYVALRLGPFKLAVVDASSPRDLLGLDAADRPRSELCGYVHDLDAVLRRLRDAGVKVLREPGVMPWGERMGYVADPEGNPVQLIQAERNLTQAERNAG